MEVVTQKLQLEALDKQTFEHFKFRVLQTMDRHVPSLCTFLWLHSLPPLWVWGDGRADSQRVLSCVRGLWSLSSRGREACIELFSPAVRLWRFLRTAECHPAGPRRPDAHASILEPGDWKQRQAVISVLQPWDSWLFKRLPMVVNPALSNLYWGWGESMELWDAGVLRMYRCNWKCFTVKGFHRVAFSSRVIFGALWPALECFTWHECLFTHLLKRHIKMF